MKDKKVVFMGTPEFAVPVLKKLIENTNVMLAVTQPDKFVGRKKELKFSPIKEVALKNNINVFQPNRIRDDYKCILDINPDIIISCAYGQIIPKDLLEVPKFGAINVHASLLPKLRGGAPIHHALIDGYSETGVTIMYMSEGMDEGDIISSEKIEITNEDNVGTLHNKLSAVGASLLIETLPSIFEGTCKRIKQNSDEATYAYNIKREEENIDFNKSAIEVCNLVRGLYPFPKAYTILNGEEIKILECSLYDKEDGVPGQITDIIKDGIIIKCRDISVLITKVQPFGKKEMNIKDFINGIRKEEYIGEILKNEKFD